MNHWTERNIDDLMARIASDFIRQLDDKMIGSDISRTDLAKRMGLTPGRVSQILNNPGNLTLRNMALFSKALGLKLTILTYEHNGAPIEPEIFRDCWLRAGKPREIKRRSR